MNFHRCQLMDVCKIIYKFGWFLQFSRRVQCTFKMCEKSNKLTDLADSEKYHNSIPEDQRQRMNL